MGVSAPRTFYNPLDLSQYLLNAFVNSYTSLSTLRVRPMLIHVIVNLYCLPT